MTTLEVTAKIVATGGLLFLTYWPIDFIVFVRHEPNFTLRDYLKLVAILAVAGLTALGIWV